MKAFGRTGITTGACSAAAAKAAALMLLTGKQAENVTITLKTGYTSTIGVSNAAEKAGAVSCSVIKDAGDDPDVTNGIAITATVSKRDSGIVIDGGEGIGRVTKPGLRVPVGMAAINPVPLEMIEAEVKAVCAQCGYTGGIEIIISAPEGAEIAKKTMNERLGVVGGISILGTTGIVEPMSEKALIDTIRTEIDVHVASGHKNLLVTPGNYGRDFAESELGFNMEQALKCSNFIGETLDYARFAGIKSITLIGHAGKLLKLAGGIMNTHSRVADCRMEILAAHCALAGAPRELIAEIMGCVTVDAAIEIMKKNCLNEQVWRSIEEKISYHLRERTEAAIPLRFIVFSLKYGVLIDSEAIEGSGSRERKAIRNWGGPGRP